MSRPEIAPISETAAYRAGGLLYRPAETGDDATLRAILRDIPTESWVTLATEYEPSYFASSDLFGHRQTMIAERGGMPVGMCCFTAMPVHIDGRVKTANYLAELRVKPKFRNRLAVIKNGFRGVQQIAGDSACRGHWFTSIASENLVARRLLEANLNGMPRYRPLGELLTMAIPVRSGHDGLQLDSARPCDIAELVDFYNRQARACQYAPALDAGWLRQLDGSNGLEIGDFWLLRQDGAIKACFALWDHRAFKQTVVRAYRFPLDLLRRPANLISRISGQVRLPAVGEAIDYLFIAFLAIDKSIELRLQQLIETALGKAAGKRAEFAMLGMSADNPLVKHLNGLSRRIYRSSIEAVSWPGQSVQPREAGLASGIVQPEIALL